MFTDNNCIYNYIIINIESARVTPAALAVLGFAEVRKTSPQQRTASTVNFLLFVLHFRYNSGKSSVTYIINMFNDMLNYFGIFIHK
jgi:hypothetical protein